MLFRFTPFANAAAAHPLFQQDVRGLARLRNFAKLRHTTLISFAWGLGFSILFLLVIMFLAYPSSFTLLSRAGNASFFLLVVSILLMFIMDTACVFKSANSINREFANGRWDILKLAGLAESTFVRVKHGIAQLKAWRLFSGVMGLRFTALLAYTLINLPTQRLGFAGLLQTLIFAWMLLFQPYWHLKTTAALTIFSSTHTRSITTAYLLSGALIFVLWLIEFGCWYVGIIYLSELTSNHWFGTYLTPQEYLSALIGFVVPTYGVLYLIRSAALRLTARHLSTMET